MNDTKQPENPEDPKAPERPEAPTPEAPSPEATEPTSLPAAGDDDFTARAAAWNGAAVPPPPAPPQGAPPAPPAPTTPPAPPAVPSAAVPPVPPAQVPAAPAPVPPAPAPAAPASVPPDPAAPQAYDPNAAGYASYPGGPGSPGVPGVPAAPGGPGQPPARRGLPAWAWWVIGGGAALLALLIVGGALLLGGAFGGGAKGVANDYVAALDAGKIAQANKLARVSDTDKRQAVLVSDAYQEAEQATDYTVGRFSEHDDRATVEVSYKLDGSKLKDYLELSKDDDGWYVSRGLTYQLPKVYSSSIEGYRIPGFDGVIGSDLDLEAYPGVYEMLAPNKLFELAEPVTFEIGAQSSTVEPVFQPSKEFLSSVDQQLKAHIDDCMKQVDTSNIYGLSSCGFSAYPKKTYGVTSFTVKISKYPTTGVDSNGSVEVADTGSVTVVVKGKRLGGKAGTEKISTEFSRLYFTPEVEGDKVTVQFY